MTLSACIYALSYYVNYCIIVFQCDNSDQIYEKPFGHFCGIGSHILKNSKINHEIGTDAFSWDGEGVGFL